MDALTEATLPRSNGAPVFEAPWQARAHAMAVLSVEAIDGEWDDFRCHLIAAISQDERRPYWESWVAALEEFVGHRLDNPRAASSAGGTQAGFSADA